MLLSASGSVDTDNTKIGTRNLEVNAGKALEKFKGRRDLCFSVQDRQSR